MKLSIPYNADKRLLLSLFDSEIAVSIKEIYFAGNPLKIPSGRRPKIKNYIIKNGSSYYFDDVKFNKDIEYLISSCNSRGIKCNLLLNIDRILDNKALKYVQELIEMGVTILTIGSHSMFSQIKMRLKGNYKMQNSVYIRLYGFNDIIKVIRSGAKILLLPPDKNHDFEYIGKVKKLTEKYDIELKIMVNEGCLKNCSYRQVDQILAQNYPIDLAMTDYINNPKEIRILNQPCRLYMNTHGILETNFIHPAFINKYECFDPIYKIVGRSFDSKRILTVIRAYFAGYYYGDLRNIIENFKHSQEPVYFGREQKTQFLLEEATISAIVH